MVEACPVGLVLPVDSYQDARGAVELTVAAERAGLESVCCGELASYDSMALLGAVAHATERIALESTVVSVTARSGALIAMGASTIADLSNDRYRLGVGFGSSTIGGWHGRELPPPLPMMRAAVTDLRAALAGSAIDRWAGFRLLGAPRPLPIRLAALNPRMIALAGELADGVIFTFSGPAQVEAMAPIARRAALAVGRPSPAVVATSWLFTGPDLAAGRRLVREAVAPYFGVATYQGLAHSLAGAEVAAEIADALGRRGRRAAAALIPDAVVDSIAVVGGPAQVAARIAAYVSAGATSVHFIPVRYGSTSASVSEAVDVLGDVAAAAPSCQP
jgi:alkanesulfonate monooxygenase SsuD/methylene tetrahydromethanopterin reductase-like flavin-dependent oxidoreductase (luciferase family)